MRREILWSVNELLQERKSFAWDRDGRRDLLNVNMLRLDGDSIHYGDEKPVREQYIVEDSSSLVNIRKLLSELYHIVSDMSEYLAIKQILDQDTGGGISEEEECDLIMDCLMFQNPNNLLCVRKTSDLSIFCRIF
ncbi:hypothetical protein BC829DRAFT_49282 [Chytridium lagenaria]|nr:hypothetical protein BC829DRAFT_49282 [Chytridium lagenaria]